jgi:hypothetical protein
MTGVDPAAVFTPAQLEAIDRRIEATVDQRVESRLRELAEASRRRRRAERIDTTFVGHVLKKTLDGEPMARLSEWLSRHPEMVARVPERRRRSVERWRDGKVRAQLLKLEIVWEQDFGLHRLELEKLLSGQTADQEVEAV